MSEITPETVLLSTGSSQIKSYARSRDIISTFLEMNVDGAEIIPCYTKRKMVNIYSSLNYYLQLHSDIPVRVEKRGNKVLLWSVLCHTNSTKSL